MKQEVADYVAQCLTSQRVKIEHQRPAGLLQPLDVPQWKWDSVPMDFVMGLPLTQRKHDVIWVIVDRLMKSAHFIAMRNKWTLDELARAYLEKIVRLHGVPSSIVSDRDTQFQSGFWQKLQEAFRTLLRFSTAFHPVTDGQTERTIQTLEDILRACALDFKSAWDEQLVLIEFSYNNSYHGVLAWPRTRYYIRENAGLRFVGKRSMRP